ncbi:MAG TPA: bifunctional adenosylcobinamide kinase/adenosylcobinamide-phosphate guanylyltransferase [Anaerolineae bacterium]|nr:bifunctional adenosylcobinamide kinase/adenosylcobinamide-phosphate guanylyltransferase [Anaerolineae bacterium]
MGKNDSTMTLILGGARSGKSTYAEALASRLGQRVLYVATAEALDDEMRARVVAHQARRPPEWTTLEVPLDVGLALQASPQAAKADVILLDCLTLLVSNVILLGAGDDGAGDESESPAMDTEIAWTRIQGEIEGLLEAYHALKAHFIVVSNEVGLGVIPPYRLGRVYRDCLGWANQALIQAADHAILMIAGQPVDLKQLPLAHLG